MNPPKKENNFSFKYIHFLGTGKRATASLQPMTKAETNKESWDVSLGSLAFMEFEEYMQTFT